MSDTELALVVGLAMAVGLVGTIFPILPGLMLIWAAALVYGLVGGFGGVGIAAMVVITVLSIAGVAAGVVIPNKAAGTAGASKSSLLRAASARRTISMRSCDICGAVSLVEERVGIYSAPA